MAPLIEMEANQIRSLGGNGGGTIPTEVPCLSTLIAAQTTRTVDSIMRLATLSTVAPALLTPRSRIETLGFLHQNSSLLPMLCLPLTYVLQINLPPEPWISCRPMSSR